MNRFFLFLLFVGLIAKAQQPEQVLSSTPIYASVVDDNTSPKVSKAKPFVMDKIAPQSTSGFAVGATPVNSGVSPTGAFTYEIPIAVPPGVQDVQPNIALTYNSQSGNGLAGWGWNISGLSTISRVGSTLHHDGKIDPVDYDNLDRFALDGQRLILLSGTYGKPGAVYTTENYSNIKITCYGTHPRGSRYGPKKFIVHYPDGSKAHYGYYGIGLSAGRMQTSASNVEWVITQWEDGHSNMVWYSYEFSGAINGSLRVTKINYGRNTLLFHYKNRQRHESSYVGGNLLSRENILSQIEVKHKDTPYRKYTLSHQTTSLGYEKVIRLQETDGSGARRMPVWFSYESNSSNSHIHSSNMRTAFNPGIHHKKTELVTGNLNRDANLDFVAYNKDHKDELHIYTKAFLPNSKEKEIVARKVKVSKFDDVFTASVINKNGGTDAFQRVVTVEEKIVNYRAMVTFKVYGEMPNTEGEKVFIDYSKQWNAPIRTDYICEDVPYFEEDSKKGGKIDVKYRTIPKTYVSGDFNGDGLTDILAIDKSYTRINCHSSPNDCKHDDIKKGVDRSRKDGSYKVEEEEGCGCQCNNYTVSGGGAYIMNLNRNSTSIASWAGTIPNFSYNDRLFTADFNGDGKTDVWHLEDKSLKIYSLINNRLTKIQHRTNDDQIRTYLPTLLGDYNGDGKTDFITPKAEKNTTTWYMYTSAGNHFLKHKRTLPFEFKIPVDKVGYYSQNHYVPQDINQDGKTDIIVHKVAHRFHPSEDDSDVDPEDESDIDILYYFREEIRLFENFGASKFNMTKKFNYLHSGSKDDPTKMIKHSIPVFTGINNYNKKMQYAIISRRLIKRYDISTPHKRNMRLRGVSNHGVRTQIDYAGLDAKDYGGIYQQDNGLQYPFVHVNHAPGMELVHKLTQSVRGHKRTQQFKYKGAVSHMRGLGFMGFTGLARSNLYGDNVAALWTVSKQDPTLRGATTEQWTDPSYSFDSKCYVSKTVTGYRTELRPNKVFVNVPKHMATHNNLTGVLHERFFTYDSYFNLKTEREKTEGLDKTTTYEYYNNPHASTIPNYFNKVKYHIGRLKWEKTIAKVPGATDFWTEKSYSYENNLLKTEKVRANGSNWRSTTYTYTPDYGNVETKTLSVPGKPVRTESFTYYPNGRDLKTHTDVLGLTTTYEYYPYGALKKETDPYGNSTQYTYDGWNRLHKTTNYLGRVTEVNYAHRSYGGVLKTINHPNTKADTRTYYNALGWIDAVHTQVSDTQWSRVYYQRDAAGRVTRESIPSFSNPKKWNVTHYDLYGRISKLQEATGKVINTHYDGLRTQVNDGVKTATTTKNALDQIVELADLGGTIRYAYHANGELREADYGGYVVSTEIDNWGRKSKLIDPTAGTFGYKHNDWGELEEETAPKGKTVYRYDAYGRMTQKDWTGSLTNMKTNYVYNGSSKLLDYVNTTDSQNNTTHRITYSYDAYKRINKLDEKGTHANFSKTLSYDYYGRLFVEVFNATDNKSKKTYNTNVIYNYDATGSTDKLSYRGYSQYELWQADERNALGQVTKSKTGNGFKKTKTIDAFGFVGGITDKKGLAIHQKALDLSYTFNVKRGLLMARSDHLLGIKNQQFDYDNMDRLTQAQSDTDNLTQARTRGYDPRGRLTQDTFMGINLTYGSGNDRYRLTGAELNPNGVAYYNKHKDRKLTYNADRKPVEVHDVGNGRITFNYSHDGHRQEVWYGGEDADKTQRNYHKTYSRIAPIELVRDLENNTQKFLTYLGGDAYSAPVVHVKDTRANSPNGHHYLHRDYLGSILAVSNSSGEVIERAHFGAWGDVAVISDPSASSGSSGGTEPVEVLTGQKAAAAFADSLTGRGFTGHEHFTEVGLVHMNGRMYDAQQGRFLSPDNHIQDPFNTQNFNRYGYVLNNPLSLTDTSGEIFGTLFAIVKFISYALTAIQAIDSIVHGAPVFQVLVGVGIGLLAGSLGGGIGEGLKGVFSAATTAVGAFIRSAVSAFAGQLISGTLASVVQGTNFRKALRANFASAGIAAAAGGIAGASEFKANKRALAKQQFENRKQLDAMAEQANSRLADGMTSNTRLEANRDLSISELSPRNTNGFDIDSAVETLNKNAHATSQQQCGRYVRLALEDGGINTSNALNNLELTHAYKYDKFLSNQGFSKIGQNTLNSYSPLKGDIIVFKNTSNHLSGHIQMFNGSNWVSDFVQQTPYPWNDYGGYSIFRW